MFTKNYEEQLASWKSFRDSLETTETPFEDVVQQYAKAPGTRLTCDPWDQKNWPGPWELLQENQYCEFGTVLGMCYSLQLTDRFKGSKFEIHISTNREKSETHYLLIVDDHTVVGYKGRVICKEDLPDALYSQRIYECNELQ
jgi:hypothetical protein